MRSLPGAALCVLALLAGCRDFALPSNEDQPPAIQTIRTYPAAVAGEGVAVEAFTGQSFWLEGKNLAAGGGETPQVTVGGAQARIVASSDEGVEAQVPAGLAKGAQPVRLSTSVGEADAPAKLAVLGDGHLQGRGDTGRAALVSMPYSGALGKDSAAYVDAALGRLVVTPRKPTEGSRYFLTMGFARDWVDLVTPVDLAAAPGGFFVRLASLTAVPDQVASAVVWLSDQQAVPVVAAGCDKLPVASCPEWGGMLAGRGAAKLAYSHSLSGVAWLDLSVHDATRITVNLDVTGAGVPTRRYDLGFEIFQLGYPVAFALADPDPGAARPGRLSIVTLDDQKRCAVHDWTWTLGGGQPQLSARKVRALPGAGECGAGDAEFDASGRLAVLDGRGAILREHGDGFETLELPVTPVEEGEPARALGASSDSALLVAVGSGILRVGPGSPPGAGAGADAGGLAPIDGFLATSGAPVRLSRNPLQGTEFVAVMQRRDLLVATAPLAFLDARGPTLLSEAAPSYVFFRLAYLEQRGQLVSLSPDMMQAVAGDLASGLATPVPEMGDWLYGFRGWACDGSRIAVASGGAVEGPNPSGPKVGLITFAPKGADAGAGGGDVQVKDLPLPAGPGDAILGIATWGADWVVARRTDAQIVLSDGSAAATTVAYQGTVSVPGQFKPQCGDKLCPAMEGFGALTPLVADRVRGSLFLPQASETPDLDHPAAAPALAEISLAGGDAGAVRWTMTLPEDRIVFDLSLSRRGDTLAVAARPVALDFGRPGGAADAFVVRRDGAGAWGSWCRLGRDSVTAVALAPDGTRLYVGTIGGQVHEVTSFDCPTSDRILTADPVPYALVGDYYTKVSALVPSLDGLRLGYVRQGRTATFGFLQ